MKWSTFYENLWEWSDSTRRSRISSLEDIGPGAEVVEAVYEIQDPKVKAQLIRKAMKLGARFSADDFGELEGEISEELYAQLAVYAGLDRDDPYLDENNMSWSDFYNAYDAWNEETLERRVKLLRDFGPSEEVCQAILDMPNSAMEGLLYRKAVLTGVRFTQSELEDMNRWDEIPEEPEELEETELPDMPVMMPQSRPRPIKGFFAVLATIFMANQVISLFEKPKPKDTGRCNGDCDNCPPHYGYRYGRWYYGHGHQSGCERGGNGGLWGKTYRD